MRSLPPRTLVKRGLMGRWLLVPVDFYQTSDGLTVTTIDKYETTDVDGEWAWLQRELTTSESHATKQEFKSCKRCQQQPKRKYGVYRTEIISDYSKIAEGQNAD